MFLECKYTYSYYDLFDENIYKENNNIKKEMEILSKSKIEEIVPKNEREIKIKLHHIINNLQPDI